VTPNLSVASVGNPPKSNEVPESLASHGYEIANSADAFTMTGSRQIDMLTENLVTENRSVPLRSSHSLVIRPVIKRGVALALVFDPNNDPIRARVFCGCAEISTPCRLF
jgi:hypothetical protein